MGEEGQVSVGPGPNKMHRIAWLVLFLAFRIRATTIVTIVTAHDIVVCADSLTGVNQTGNIAPIKPSAEQRQKLFVIQDRLVVAHDGNAALYFGEYDGKKAVPLATPYFALDIITKLRRDTSVMYTLAGIAEFARDKLVAQFKDFDVILKSGAMKRQEGHPMDDDPITNFTIAGYDGDRHGHVYQVGVGINWNRLAHVIHPVVTLYPEAVHRNISLFMSGYSDAIEDLWKRPDSPGTSRFIGEFPALYRALASDLDLTVGQVVVLARAILALQIARSPTTVAYPLTVATIPAGGRVTIQSYKK